ncbi:periplasmic chaperone for outer membrane proteins Skp [Dyadobacter koreensis]|uniref:Periplasmic chaperone for outer membrane proteins Skp n=1 Tax=Dyadobacter koreensis TaxID=408657 RepID=A0A1H6QKG0_9BACT|nr:OmpH family outer membrane protein [Dyadobacter koreensis]SEI44241.1 periplasmic chaperone for outer membrane proteins Skp [Dyadobacter koreensis]
MRSLTLLCLLFCLSLTVSFGQNTSEKIGYVDQQLIIERMPEFKKLNQEITLKSQQYEKVLKGKFDDYEAKSAALDKLVAGKAEQMILRDKALELDNLKKSYEEFEANAMKELREYYTKKFTPIKQKVNEAIVFAGRQKGYSFILRMDLNPDGGDMWPVVLFARDSTSNLSADIMKNLGIDSTAASARKIGIPQMLQQK